MSQEKKSHFRTTQYKTSQLQNVPSLKTTQPQNAPKLKTFQASKRPNPKMSQASKRPKPQNVPSLQTSQLSYNGRL
jgi:hypothetical protein